MRHKSAVVALAGTLALVGSEANAQRTELRNERHGVWGMTCSKDRMNDALACNVFSRARGGGVEPLIMVIGRPNAAPEFFIAANNAFLTSGGYRIGSQPAENFRSCSSTQCYPAAGRSAPVIAAMEAAPESTIYVRAVNRIGPMAEGEVTLQGFKEAMDALRKALTELK